MSVRTTLLTAVALLVPNLALASGVNVESRRPALDHPGGQFEAQGNFGFRQGNANVLETGLKARIAYQHDDHLLFYFHDSAMSARTLAKNGGGVRELGSRDTRFINRHMGHLRYSLRIMDWFRAEAFTQLETNEFLLIRTRFLLGAVPRFTLYYDERFGMYLGPGYIAEYEELDSRVFITQPGTDDPDNWWHRANVMLNLSYQLTDRLAMRSTTYAQPRIDKPQDIVVLNDNAIDVKVADHFELRLTAGLRYDSAPATFCAMDLGGVACPAAEVRQVVGTEVHIANSLAVTF